jgi:hypothetical protein
VTDLAINRATEADASDLGIIGPAAYAAAYHDDWDDAVGFFHQLKTFGADAMLATLARPEARVWIARQDGAGVGFLTMFVGSLEPIGQRAGGAEIRASIFCPAPGVAASASCSTLPKPRRRPKAAAMSGSTSWSTPNGPAPPMSAGALSTSAASCSRVACAPAAAAPCA